MKIIKTVAKNYTTQFIYLKNKMIDNNISTLVVVSGGINGV